MRIMAIVAVATALGLAGTTVAAQDITDARIAAIVVTANQVDIDAGKVAEKGATDPRVRAFGTQMATDHAGVNTQAGELVAKLGVTPEDNPTARALKSGGADHLKRLQGLKGAAFDRAYVEHEVAYHQQVLDALDTTLIPGAKNGQLKALLVKVRPAFVAHLEHARMLERSIGR